MFRSARPLGDTRRIANELPVTSTGSKVRWFSNSLSINAPVLAGTWSTWTSAETIAEPRAGTSTGNISAEPAAEAKTRRAIVRKSGDSRTARRCDDLAFAPTRYVSPRASPCPAGQPLDSRKRIATSFWNAGADA